MKRLARSILGRLGYDLRRKRGESSAPAPGFHPSYLARLCQPRTVFDVGVGYGSHFLYRAFPDARFLLFEPLRDFEKAIQEIGEQYDCEVFFKAAGDREGQAEIVVDTQDLQRSSFAERTALSSLEHRMQKRTIEVTTLDRVFAENPGLERPILLKLDTEGNELSALRGAKTLLEATDTVIAEVSIARRFEGSYEFEDVVLFMREAGFQLFGFLNVAHAPGELRPRFADVVFKRRGAEG